MKNISKVLTGIIFFLSIFKASITLGQGKTEENTSEVLEAVQKKYGLDPGKPLTQRVERTPDDVIKMFREAGMSPAEHRLTQEEASIVASAFAVLPPLHQRVLKQHLKSISFLDNMPNTALTSPITDKENVNLYHITFRAGILHQTVSEWLTEKERKCYTAAPSLSISVQAGLLSALTYVLLHEGTHVVDGSIYLISVDTIAGKPRMTAFARDFSKGVWRNINSHSWPFKDSLVVKSIFRPAGRRYLPAEATLVYGELIHTPFVSLYSTASWHEDLAELVTVYHLTKVFNQPFRIQIKKEGKVLQDFEPMRSETVQKRLRLLQRFYDDV
ncbi:hypothetical protein ACFQZI_11465 [Mucilaginibacter lutimaris]|uniref:Secreted protein n=1 Tax=Mucilaginibacter lutimaris TaxID=931629 RepID=A0ABW2ZH37_9SPHI